MNDRAELARVARQLRAHVEWLHEQGETGLPRVAGEPASANKPRSIGSPMSPLAALDDAIGGLRQAVAPVSVQPARPALIAIGEQRSLEAIREELGECTRCRLSSTRKKIVFGVGDPSADLMFVGEGPGHDEDVTGEPFVGAAGKLLTRIIGAMGMTREEVYIANVVKCRPPENRDPEVDEVAACSPFLFHQIASIRPKVIVALGRPSCATLIGAPLTTPISKLRGKFLKYRGEIPLMPTFHPAYLLRSPEKKREVWDDMKAVVAELQRLTGKTYVLAG